MTRRCALFSLFTLALFVAGCGAQQGETMVTYNKGGGDPIVSTAPETGRYQLFTMTDVTPRTTVSVNKGDRLGFEKTADGKVRAIAGSETIDLSDKTVKAYWKLQER